MFPVVACDGQFFIALLRTLRYYGEMPVHNFMQPDDKECRHRIDWKDTNMPDGFVYSKPDDIGTDDAWQFGLQDNDGNAKPTKWRVHGYIDNQTFFIVWLDPNHALDGTPDCVTKRRRDRK